VLENVVVILDRQALLLEIVRALHPTRRFASCLYGRQEQTDQHANDRNDHQEFNQRETQPIFTDSNIASGHHDKPHGTRIEHLGLELSL
jgi:hypothetical protein